MDDRTESFETYEPESYEWDYEEGRDRPPRVLWGRILALIILLIAAFWAGRSTAPVDDQSGALELANERAEQAESEIQELERQLARRNAAAAASPTPEPAADETTSPKGEEEIYIVKSGDSLAAIALRFYGDSTLADVIADANDIDDPQSIRPGDELVIPPAP